MPGDGRRGRRDNGLDAVAYVPLVDVDPRVGEHLLDVLGSAGVPAYLEPSVDVEPYTRAMSLPSPPTDRLWVDRDQRLAARQIVEAETPHGTRPRPTPREDEPSHGLTDAEEERAWQAIVAGWDAAAPAAPPGEHRRAEPDTDGPPAADGPSPAGPSPAGASPAGGPEEPAEEDRPRPAGPGRREPEDLVTDPWAEAEEDRPRWRRSRGGPADDDPLPSGRDLDRAAEARAKHEADAADDDVWIEGPPTLDGTEEHFEPPPPPPYPTPSRNAVVAVLLLALGVLFLAAPGWLGFDDRTGLTFGVLAILGGGVLLVLRLRDVRADDGPDDGAVV